MFAWYVVLWESKTKYHKNTLKSNCSNYINHSILEHPLGGPMYPTKKPTNMRFQWPKPNKRRGGGRGSDFQSVNVCRYLLVDLLMQHKSRRLKLTGRKLEHMRNKPNNSHIPYYLRFWFERFPIYHKPTNIEDTWTNHKGYLVHAVTVWGPWMAARALHGAKWPLDWLPSFWRSKLNVGFEPLYVGVESAAPLA